MTQATQQIQPPSGDDKPVSFIPYGSSDQIKLSIAIIQNILAVRTRSGKTCGRNDAIKFLMMCQARRLNPFEGDAFLVGYDGKDGPTFSLITAHQAFLKRAEIHPEFDGMLSGVIVKSEDGTISDIEGDFYLPEQEVVGGWATVFFKNRKRPTTRRIRMERFNKGFAQWQVDAAGMIVKCAESDALRSSFPTMLGGLFMREEISIDVSSTQQKDVRELGNLVEVRQSIEAPRESFKSQSADDERAEADAGLAPARPKQPEASPAPAHAPGTPVPQPEPSEEVNRSLLLEREILSLGFSFSVFQRWAVEGGALANADSISSFAEIPSEDAVRIMRFFKGRSRQLGIDQMNKIKGDLL